MKYHIEKDEINNESIFTVVNNSTGKPVYGGVFKDQGLAEEHCQLLNISTSGSKEIARALNLLSFEVLNLSGASFYVASSSSQRAKGLSGLTALDKDGMVFVYEELSTSSFTMEKTKLNLTLTFVDGGGNILYSQDHYANMSKPINPDVEYKFVIETLVDSKLDLSLLAKEIAKHYKKKKEVKKRGKDW